MSNAFFFWKKKNQPIVCLRLSDNTKIGTATLVVLELLLIREFAVTDVAVRRGSGQTRTIDVPARLDVIRKS
jgi:hypothetical protein